MVIVQEILSDEELRKIEKGLNRCHVLKIEGIDNGRVLRKSKRSGLNYIFRLLSTRNTRSVVSNNIQCIPNKRRSSGDIYRIMRYYYPDITFKEVRNLLFDMLNSGTLSTLYCGTISKRVFYSNENLYKYSNLEFMRDYYKKNKHQISESINSSGEKDEYGKTIELI
jgi:hypothetical protein